MDSIDTQFISLMSLYFLLLFLYNISLSGDMSSKIPLFDSEPLINPLSYCSSSSLSKVKDVLSPKILGWKVIFTKNIIANIVDIPTTIKNIILNDKFLVPATPSVVKTKDLVPPKIESGIIRFSIHNILSLW